MQIMISIGLMPSDTGKPGWKIIGQHLSDFPIKKESLSQFSMNLKEETLS